MNFAEVKQMMDAGFTADEIRRFFNTDQPDPGHSDSPFPAKEEGGKSSGDAGNIPEDPPQAGKQEPAAWEQAITKLTEQVSALTNMVQKNNIINSNMPEVPKESPEDIIASIIYPNQKKTG